MSPFRRVRTARQRVATERSWKGSIMASKKRPTVALYLRYSTRNPSMILASVVKTVAPGSDDAECHPNTTFITPDDVPTALGTLFTDHGDLALNAYVPEKGRGFWGPRVAYEDVYMTDLRQAESMVKALAKIDRALAKLRERFGYTEDFSAMFLRFADVLGVSEVYVTQAVQIHARRPEWSLSNDRVCTPQEAASMIRSIEDRANKSASEEHAS